MLEESRLWACWLAATHVQRRCWAVLAHATGRVAWKIPETASLRHRNGAVSFPDMFPCTTPGLGAEWLLAGRVAMQEAALAWGRARKFQRSKRLLQRFRHHIGQAPLQGWIPSPWQHPDLWLWCSGDRHFPSGVCSALCGGRVRIPQPGLTPFLKATALYYNEPGSKPKKSQEHNFLFLI